MGRSSCCSVLKLPFTCLVVLSLSLILLETPAFTITASIGRPYHGRLANGVPFPTQFQGYYLRDQERSYATPEAIGTVLDAIDAVRAKYPDTCDLFIGDFSLPGGGRINMHRSHQNGRDVDLGMYAKDNRPLDTLVPMNEENLDVAKTWCLIDSMLRSQHVQYLFLDRRIQRLLHDYALSRGVDPNYLETLFGNNSSSPIVHVRGHYDHMHVRFYTPWSTMAARTVAEDAQQQTVVETAQQAYLPKRVNYYVNGSEHSLATLAQSFGVNQNDLCRWNQMDLNDALTPGACLVFYKRGFEVEPLHLARSLQPDSVSDALGVQLVSAETSGSLSARTTAGRRSYSTERKSTLSSGYAYTVHRGDTLEKVAKRAGINVKALCALNGLKLKAGVRPGQRIKLVNAKSPDACSTSARPSAAKSMPAVAVTSSKASGRFVPAVYTKERNISQRSVSKQSTPAQGALQANRKPVNDSKAKVNSAPQQKLSGTQKTSAGIASSKSSSTQVAKVDKTPKKSLER